MNFKYGYPFEEMANLSENDNITLGFQITPARSIFKWGLDFDVNVLAGFEV